MTARHRPTVAVVGGGIAGLAAAWELVRTADQAGTAPPIVHLLESTGRIGGKLAAVDFAGRRVDVAADAFLARRPEATELCAELGLTASLIPVGASGASVWARGRLRAMPGGLNLGVPTRWWPLARSGILTPAESLRVAKDLLVPHLGAGLLIGDRSVGEIVGGRLGRPVVDRLVDPLIGGINAGGVDDLSAAAAMPVLIAAAHQPGSLMRRLRRARTPAPDPGPVPVDETPLFWSLGGGTASLAERLGTALAERGVTIRTGVAVDAVERTGPHGSDPARWRLTLGPGRGGDPVAGDGPGDGPGVSGALSADGVVLAVPSTEAAVLLAPHAPVAAGLLSTIEYASVSVVTLVVADDAIGVPRRGTGFLVPRTTTFDGRPALVTGCTYLDRKWPHLGRPGQALLRASVGRLGDERHLGLDDDQLTASVFAELAHTLGIGGAPVDSLVTRWERSFPQYRVGHLLRVAKIEQAVATLDGMAVAGAALRGVGIPACIGSGRTAARRVLASLADGASLPEEWPDATDAGR